MKRPTIITRQSPFSGEINEMTMLLDPADVRAWEDGKLIQDALPYLSAGEREFLKTGITPQEWDEAFKPTF